MSALLHLGEADHNILRANAELELARRTLNPHQAAEAMLRANVLLLDAHAVLGAVRFVMRSCHLNQCLHYHRTMATDLAAAADKARMPPVCSMRNRAKDHAHFAKALETLIGES